MKFTPEFIEKVRQANSLVELVSQHSQLKRSGMRLMGRCPLPGHGDKTPSFSVSEEAQLFHCFGCKKSGNVFHFIEYQNGLSFPEAVEFLARKAGIPLPEVGINNLRPSLGAINSRTANFYHKKLLSINEVGPVVSYLKKRKLTPELIETFRIGYAGSEWSELAEQLQAAKIDLADAEKLGLIRRRKTGNGYYDLFRDRLMFPILSTSQEVIGFGGRIFGDEQPKYLNSPESPLFHKGQVLYGIHETAKYIRTQDEVIVVEGYMDLISLYGAGIKNVVAILGTAFTSDHGRILKRYTKNIKILLDGDNAGFEGAERSLPILMAEGLMPKAVLLPQGKDPDDFINEFGAEKLRADLDRATDLFYLILDRKIKTYGFEPSDKIRLLEDWVRKLRTESEASRADDMQDPSRNRAELPAWEVYLDGLAQRLGLQLNLVRKVTKPVTLNQSLSRNSKTWPTQVNFGVKKVEQKQVDTLESTMEAEHASRHPILHEVPLSRIEISNAPAEESQLVAVLLANEECFLDGIGQSTALSHGGLRLLLNRAKAIYDDNAGLQKPTEFASLRALLVTEVSPPSALTAFLDLTEGKTVDQLKSMMAELYRKIATNKVKIESQKVAAKLKFEPSQENMEKFMELQRQRLAVKDSNSNSET